MKKTSSSVVQICDVLVVNLVDCIYSYHLYGDVLVWRIYDYLGKKLPSLSSWCVCVCVCESVFICYYILVYIYLNMKYQYNRYVIWVGVHMYNYSLYKWLLLVTPGMVGGFLKFLKLFRILMFFSLVSFA